MSVSLAPRTVAPAQAEMSDVNLAARQRMLSQRVVFQTMLAVQGKEAFATTAQQTLRLFRESQHKLEAKPTALGGEAARILHEVYHGADGVSPIVEDFADKVARTLQLAGAGSPGAEQALAELVESTDGALAALNAATAAFDQVAKADSEHLLSELAQIVTSIQAIAREAKMVSFNARVVAARAGNVGREFAVVANVLSDITTEIDGLSLQAVNLAAQHR